MLLGVPGHLLGQQARTLDHVELDLRSRRRRAAPGDPAVPQPAQEQDHDRGGEQRGDHHQHDADDLQDGPEPARVARPPSRGVGVGETRRHRGAAATRPVRGAVAGGTVPAEHLTGPDGRRPGDEQGHEEHRSRHRGHGHRRRTSGPHGQEPTGRAGPDPSRRANGSGAPKRPRNRSPGPGQAGGANGAVPGTRRRPAIPEWARANASSRARSPTPLEPASGAIATVDSTPSARRRRPGSRCRSRRGCRARRCRRPSSSRRRCRPARRRSSGTARSSAARLELTPRVDLRGGRGTAEETPSGPPQNGTVGFTLRDVGRVDPDQREVVVGARVGRRSCPRGASPATSCRRAVPRPTVVPDVATVAPVAKRTAVPIGWEAVVQPSVSVWRALAGAVGGVADVDVARGVGEDEVAGALGSGGEHLDAGGDRGGRPGRPAGGARGARAGRGRGGGPGEGEQEEESRNGQGRDPGGSHARTTNDGPVRLRGQGRRS